MEQLRFGILVPYDFLKNVRPDQVMIIRALAVRISTMYEGIECVAEVASGLMPGWINGWGDFIVSIPIEDFESGKSFDSGSEIAHRIRTDPVCNALLTALTGTLIKRHSGGEIPFAPFLHNGKFTPFPSPP